MSPVIHTMPGSAVFAAGKSMGQISREREEYTRGVEEARLEMQKQQIEDARKMREIAQAFQEEQAILQGLQFVKTQELSREKMVQTKELAVLGHKKAMERTKLGEAGATGRQEEKIKADVAAKETKRLEDIEWMKKISGQAESGDVEVRGFDKTGKPTGFKTVDKLQEMHKQRVTELFNKWKTSPDELTEDEQRELEVYYSAIRSRREKAEQKEAKRVKEKEEKVEEEELTRALKVRNYINSLLPTDKKGNPVNGKIRESQKKKIDKFLQEYNMAGAKYGRLQIRIDPLSSPARPGEAYYQVTVSPAMPATDKRYEILGVE